jgi:hypothetical protein
LIRRNAALSRAVIKNAGDVAIAPDLAHPDAGAAFSNGAAGLKDLQDPEGAENPN